MGRAHDLGRRSGLHISGQHMSYGAQVHVCEHTAAEAPGKESQLSVLAMRPARVTARHCTLKQHQLTIMTTICGIVERIARLPVVAPWCGGRLAHILLVVALKLFHGGGVARMLRDDKGARQRKVPRQREETCLRGLSQNIVCDYQ